MNIYSARMGENPEYLPGKLAVETTELNNIATIVSVIPISISTNALISVTTVKTMQ